MSKSSSDCAPFGAKCLLTLLVLSLAFSGAGCGAGPRPDAVAPKPIGYADGVGGDAVKCYESKATRDTLVVDMDPNDRLKLEAAMGDGLVVVHYDCDGIKLLADCQAKGSYGFNSQPLPRSSSAGVRVATCSPATTSVTPTTWARAFHKTT